MIGRNSELMALDRDLSKEEPQFVVVYGRRRIGKTYLIREKFSEQFAFYHTGVRNGTLREQLLAFRASLVQYGFGKCPVIRDWFDAFGRLSELISKSKPGRKVIFIDELPWMDTPRSNIIPALEYFWNNQASVRREKDVFLVVCGSATSWIVDNIIHNKGGLYNRLTDRIWLRPFTLAECEEYSKSLGLAFSRREICEAYMVFGGVPYYWSMLRADLSLAQNIDALCFSEHGRLFDEFGYLYASLFRNAEPHLKVVEALSGCKSGMTRSEIEDRTGIRNAGTLKKVLDELARCDFVRQFHAWHKRNRDSMFQLVDNFTLFHYSFMKKEGAGDPRFWMNSVGGARLANWEGNSFEMVCLLHIESIKRALGISGIGSEVYSWRTPMEAGGGRGAQIDLVIERQDNTVNICEVKFCRSPYEITLDEADKANNRRERFLAETGYTGTCKLTLVASNGAKPGIHRGIFQNILTLDDLFMQ